MKGSPPTRSTAIVTGGTRGVGRGISERLLAAGANVVVCGRTEPDEPIVAALSASPGEFATALFVAADVRVPEQIDRVVLHAVDTYGQIDLLVNNAGGSPHALVDDSSPNFTSKIITLNLIAPLNFSRAVNAVMQEQDSGGSIVNIGSVSGTRPSPGTAAYGAAKAGLSNLTKSLAAEWAPKVRVNCIVVGPVITEQASLHYGDGDGIEAVSRTIPMGRMAEPSDVADAVLYLASDQSRYISGTDLFVHGGGERPLWMEASTAV